METVGADIRPSNLSGEEPLLPPRGRRDEARFDITAMIDLVFMLNIFFLVTTVAAALSEMDLPVVRHTVATDGEESVVFSLVRREAGETALFVGETADKGGITDPEEQKQRVREATEEGRRADKRVVLLKAERNVKLKDVQRVGAAAAEVPGVELRLAVIEKE